MGKGNTAKIGKSGLIGSIEMTEAVNAMKEQKKKKTRTRVKLNIMLVPKWIEFGFAKKPKEISILVLPLFTALYFQIFNFQYSK